MARLSVGGAPFWVQDDPDASPVAPGVGSVRMIVSVEDPFAAFERGDASAGPPWWRPCTTSTGGGPAGSRIRSVTIGN